MNEWFRDPRVKRAEVESFEAGRAERRGDHQKARELYRAAAKAYQAVAFVVPPNHPNTRGDLAIAAVACHGRGGEFDSAIAFGQRMLAQPGALSARGQVELAKLVRDYSAVWRTLSGKALTRTWAEPGGTASAVDDPSRKKAFDRYAAPPLSDGARSAA